jgi:hypothetical protein
MNASAVSAYSGEGSLQNPAVAQLPRSSAGSPGQSPRDSRVELVRRSFGSDMREVGFVRGIMDRELDNAIHKAASPSSVHGPGG